MCTGTTFLLFFGSRIRSLVKSYLPSVTALLRPSGFFSLTKFMRSCTFPFLLRLATAIFLLFLDKSVSSSPFSALVSVLYKIVSWWESCGARDSGLRLTWLGSIGSPPRWGRDRNCSTGPGWGESSVWIQDLHCVPLLISILIVDFHHFIFT